MSRIGFGRHGKIEDQAGDPLDGLVNLFDIGIVLAVAFLIAGLTLTVNSEGEIERRAESQAAAIERSLGARPDQVKTLPEPAGNPRARGQGEAVGQVYRLADGRLIYVRKP
jgi:hypothetical protein